MHASVSAQQLQLARQLAFSSDERHVSQYPADAGVLVQARLAESYGVIGPGYLGQCGFVVAGQTDEKRYGSVCGLKLKQTRASAEIHTFVEGQSC